jgi:type IV pilus assembly protein PilM
MPSEKPKAFTTLGLQVEDHVLKAVHLTQKKGSVALIDLYTIHLNKNGAGDNVNPLYMDDQGKKLCQLMKSILTLSAISGSKTLVRPLFVKLKKDHDIDAVIEFQSEPILPFETGEAIVDWIRISTEDDGSELTIFGVKKEHVLSHLDEWKQYGVDPECISTVPAAILSFSNHFVTGLPTYFYAHMGSKNTTCGLIHQGKLLSGQFLPIGLETLIDAYAMDAEISIEQGHEEIKSFDMTSIDKDKNPHLQKAIDSFRLELLKIFYGLAKQMKGEDVGLLFMTGEGGALSRLCKRMSVDLKMELVEITIPENFGLTESVIKKNAVPLGLALSGLPMGEEQLDLRKGELAHPNPFKRLMKPLAIYFISCFLLVVGIFLYAQATIGAREDQLKEQFGDLLAYMNKPYGEFEKEYEVKVGEYDGAIIPIKKLGVPGLFERLEYLESEVDAAPQPIALMPNTPLASDVLAWLSTHPNVVLAGDEGAERESLIQIDNFIYSMVKKPDEKKRGNRYQVKVELEFTSTTPKLAREFHDALIEDNRMVDPKGEVKWSSNRGKYRTTFFLKDRTYYP